MITNKIHARHFSRYALILSALCISLMAQEPVSSLHSKARTYISGKALAIAAQQKKHRFFAYSLYGIALFQNLAQTYYLIQPLISGGPRPTESARVADLNPASITEPNAHNNVPWSTQLWTGFKALPHELSDYVVSGNIVRDSGSLFMTMSTLILSNIVVEKLMKQVGHADTITWYIKKHAPYYKTSALARDYTYACSAYSSALAAQPEAQLLNLTVKHLIQETFNILGYMEYKADSLIAIHQVRARLVQGHLLNFVIDWYRDALTALNDSNYTRVEMLLDQYDEQVGRLLRTFQSHSKFQKNAF